MGSHFDVIVLGVGGMGSATCFHLAKRGVKVLGLEQFSIGHQYGSSHGETRAIRRAYFEHPNYIPLLNRAYELWDELAELSGKHIFVRNGLVIYGNPLTSSVYQGVQKSAAAFSIPVQEFSSEGASQRFPMYRPGPEMNAIFEPDAGFLYVDQIVALHAQLARQKGAVIRENVTLESYELSGAFPSGSVTVRTNQGVFSADRLVVTAGPWSLQVLKELNFPLQLKRLFQCWFRADSIHGLDLGVPCFAFHTSSEFYYGFPMLDGQTIKVAAHFATDPIFEPGQKSDSTISEQRLVSLRQFISQYLPKVSSTLVKSSPCIYTMTPDENFIIDTHPTHSHMCFAAGFSGHGFKFSSVVGEVLSDLAMHGKTQRPIDFLRTRAF